jgi:hypothetical protein
MLRSSADKRLSMFHEGATNAGSSPGGSAGQVCVRFSGSYPIFHRRIGSLLGRTDGVKQAKAADLLPLSPPMVVSNREDYRIERAALPTRQLHYTTFLVQDKRRTSRRNGMNGSLFHCVVPPSSQRDIRSHGPVKRQPTRVCLLTTQIE